MKWITGLRNTPFVGADKVPVSLLRGVSKGGFYTDMVSQVTCCRVSGKVSSDDDNFSMQMQAKGAVSSYTFKGRVESILIAACASSSPAFCMMYSTYKLNKQGDNIQP